MVEEVGLRQPINRIKLLFSRPHENYFDKLMHPFDEF